jgi:hypothetical protein
MSEFNLIAPWVADTTLKCSFSPCQKYRYDLWRVWKQDESFPFAFLDHRYCMFIGLNPSTADDNQDDPTIRRCIQFAKDWGYDALCMTNLFAYRATLPLVMKMQGAPIGELNDETLIKISKNAGIVVAAWGNHGNFMGRGEQVKKMIPNLHALAVNKDGSPKHPLYLRADLKPFPFQ